jgi:hypothetical protein
MVATAWVVPKPPLHAPGRRFKGMERRPREFAICLPGRAASWPAEVRTPLPLHGGRARLCHSACARPQGLVPAALLLLFGAVVLLAWRDRTGCAVSADGGRRAGPGKQQQPFPEQQRREQSDEQQQQHQQQQQQQQQSAQLGGPGLLLSAAAAGLVKQAPRLLPLTNFSSLTTAALLDAQPGVSSGDARDLVRLHQEFYCRCGPTVVEVLAVGGQPKRQSGEGWAVRAVAREPGRARNAARRGARRHLALLRRRRA